MPGSGYATISRKKILEFLKKNSDWTVAVAKCGKIIHLECEFMDEISEHILKDHGFKLQCKNSILYGMCSACQESK